MSYAFWANVTLFVHLLYIGFVVFSLGFVLLGWMIEWDWVRNPWFRWIHLLSIAIVVFESLLSIRCPLTTLELYFREMAGQDHESVRYGQQIPEIPDWVWYCRKLLFPGCTPEFFIPIYLVFAMMILISLILVPPRWPRLKRIKSSPVS